MNLDENKQVTPDITTLKRDRERGYRRWRMEQIYLGQAGKGLYVPNVGDIVDDVVGGILYEKEVVGIDESTLVPTFRQLGVPEDVNLAENQFKGVGPGYQSETWRIFYDTRVEPYTLMVDSNLHIYDEDSAYIKIFKGRDISSSGRVISQYRDQNTDRYTENVPLYQLGERFDDSPAIKRPRVCHTTEKLHLGSELTVVVYSAQGQAISKNTMLVVDGSNVKQLQVETAYVSGIALVSPFISKTDDRLIEFPSNLPKDALFTMAKTMYSNGTEQTYAIDGGRFSVIGWDRYLNTLPHEVGSFGLTYQLGENELSLSAQKGEGRHITEIYRYRTLAPNGSYSVMIYPLLQFIDDDSGYTIKWMLYNLDRDLSMDITEFIEMGVNSDLFNGRKYGSVQRIVVAVELSRLGLGLEPYRHVQSFDIALRGNPILSQDPFHITFLNSKQEPFGKHSKIWLFGSTTTETAITLNHNAAFSSVEDFLNATYRLAQPLYDQNIETSAPTPTHVVLHLMDGSRSEIPLSKFNQVHLIPNPDGSMKHGTTIGMEFIRVVSPEVTQRLAILPMVLRNLS